MPDHLLSLPYQTTRAADSNIDDKYTPMSFYVDPTTGTTALPLRPKERQVDKVYRRLCCGSCWGVAIWIVAVLFILIGAFVGAIQALRSHDQSLASASKIQQVSTTVIAASPSADHTTTTVILSTVATLTIPTTIVYSIITITETGEQMLPTTVLTTTTLTSTSTYIPPIASTSTVSSLFTMTLTLETTFTSSPSASTITSSFTSTELSTALVTVNSFSIATVSDVIESYRVSANVVTQNSESVAIMTESAETVEVSPTVVTQNSVSIATVTDVSESVGMAVVSSKVAGSNASPTGPSQKSDPLPKSSPKSYPPTGAHHSLSSCSSSITTEGSPIAICAEGVGADYCPQQANHLVATRDITSGASTSKIFESSNVTVASTRLPVPNWSSPQKGPSPAPSAPNPEHPSPPSSLSSSRSVASSPGGECGVYPDFCHSKRSLETSYTAVTVITTSYDTIPYSLTTLTISASTPSPTTSTITQTTIVVVTFAPPRARSLPVTTPTPRPVVRARQDPATAPLPTSVSAPEKIKNPLKTPAFAGLIFCAAGIVLGFVLGKWGRKLWYCCCRKKVPKYEPEPYGGQFPVPAPWPGA